MKEKLMKTYKKVELKAIKHSPEILAGVGVVGVVGSLVMACKATTKLSDILEDSKEQLDKIKEVAADPAYEEKYSQDDAKKDTTITYVQTAMKVTKLYAPSVILCASSLGCLLASNNILKKRNAALSAAYMTVDKSFKEYRKRVADRFGEEVEKEIRYNIKAEEITKVDENGNAVTETVKVMDGTDDPNSYSDYARFFDESCAAWQNDAEYNLTFLKAQQQYANDLLKARGRLFLNEVYRMLGIDETKAGQVVGWVYNPDNPTGDNFVDFGIYNMQRERVRAFVNGYEPNILLDFNVDGVIWDLAWWDEMDNLGTDDIFGD
mgnify:FL=1